LVNIKINMP